MSEKNKEKPEIIKFVKPEMDLFVADDEEMPEKPDYKLSGSTGKWKTEETKSGEETVCTCNQVCTCNLVKSKSSGRSSGSRSRSRRVCSCVPVAH